MALTIAQLQTLKTDITVTRASVTYQGQTLLQWWTAGNDQAVADFYNQPVSPVVQLWRPSIATSLLNECIVGAEFVALTIAKQNLWLVLTQGDANATLARTRQNFIEVFGAGSVSMANLTAAAQKVATYAEALFSASGGTPGTGNVSAIFGVRLTGTDIAESRGV